MTLDDYFKKWNPIVYEWLYVFVYKEYLDHFTSEKRQFARFLTLLLSGLYHDFIISISFRLFLPSFTFGYSCFIFFRNLKGRFLVVSYGIQVSLALTIYTMEYYARENCPRVHDGILDVLIPRFAYC